MSVKMQPIADLLQTFTEPIHADDDRLAYLSQFLQVAVDDAEPASDLDRRSKELAKAEEKRINDRRLGDVIRNQHGFASGRPPIRRA